MDLYIERDDLTSTTKITESTDDTTSTYVSSDLNDISNFDNWSTREKVKLFINQVQTIYSAYNTGNNANGTEDDIATKKNINDLIADTIIKTSRPLVQIKYGYSRNGVPTVLLILGPINFNKITDTTLRAKIIAWGVANYLITTTT